MDGCLNSRTPSGPRRGLYSGIVFAGIGVGMVVGQGVAVASPADSAGTSQSDDASDAASTSADPSSESADAAGNDTPEASAEAADTDDAADADETDAEIAEIAETAEVDEPRQSQKRSRPTVADRAADDSSSEVTERSGEDTDTVNTTEAATEFAAIAPAPALPPAAAPESTVRSLVSARPVTAESIVTDVLTWAGLRSADDDAPAPVTPVSGLVESLWLAVRQSQYTWNNQRPLAGVTISGSGPDGTVAGSLNAVDYDDSTLTYVLASGPSHGRVVIDALGRFTYTPGAAAAGRADQFTIRVDDTPGNPFHVHGLLGLLGIARPTEVTVSIAAKSPAGLGIQSALDIEGLSSRDGVEITTGSAGGTVRVIDGRFTDQVVVNAADAAAVLNTLAPVLGAPTGFADLAEVSASTVGDGDTLERFYRFTETIGGITVLGSEVILVTDADGDVTSVFNYYRALGENFNIIPDPRIDEDAEVRLVASTAYLGSDGDSASIGSFLAASAFANDLVVYTVTEDQAPALAWRVVVHVPDTGELVPSGATYLIQADGEDAGTVIVNFSNAQAAAAVTTAKDWLGDTRTITIDTRKVLWFSSSEMADPTRNITTYKTSYGLFGLGSPVLPGKVVKRSLFGWDTSAVSAHANAAVVYDYFMNVLARQSYDGEGAKVVISIRYRPSGSVGYANAFWDPTIEQFAFGDKGYLQADVDIVAHEFTHAVISSILGDSALGSGQPGALNEAYADIFGVLVEGATGTDRWLMAEDSGYGIIRNLADPGSVSTSYGPYRDRLGDMYRGSGDDYGEHVNSTIFSHAAYLMMTDAATAGVSDETWAKVFYHSIPRLSANAQFVDGRAAVLSSAAEQGLSLAEREAIARAFDTVEIYGAPVSSIAV